MKLVFQVAMLLLVVSGCATKKVAPAEASAGQAESPAFSMGNGEANWIITEGAVRSGSTFTFPEVQIDGNGWLVMHPFENGKPNGNIYVGATYVSSGANQNVSISVEGEPVAGDMYIVMLHRDVDEDRNFDFVFVGDTGQVEDKAVFEGSMMVGHAYATP